MEDLTDFVKAAKQREDDIKDGKIFPYEKRKLLKEEQEKLEQGNSTFFVEIQIERTNFWRFTVISTSDIHVSINIVSINLLS